MSKQYVWNSDKEDFELVDVREGILAELARQDATQRKHAHNGGGSKPQEPAIESAFRLIAKAFKKVPRE
jgi:hypothetical protein